MIRPFTALILCALLSGAASAVEPIKVRIQTADKKIHIGTITGQSGSAVEFRSSAQPQPRMIPAAQIAYVKFPMKERDEEDMKRLYEAGEFRPVYSRLSEILLPYKSFVHLPSNLTRNFMYWMVSAYWAGDTDLLAELAPVIEQFKNAEFTKQVRFYRGLLLLDSGTDEDVLALMNTADIDTVYPPDSAVRLYVNACVFNRQGEPLKAIRTAALLMAKHSRDTDWMPLAELLCAEIYFQLDMPESAKAALADINEFYADPEILNKAAAIAAQ